MAEREFDIEDEMRRRGVTDPFAPVSSGMPVGAPVAAGDVQAPAMDPAALSMQGSGLPSREDRDRLTWGSKGQMSGFQVGSDYGGDTKARNSMKNTFGRLASQFGASTPDAVRQLVQTEDFRRYFPNARLLDHATDPKIDFGGQLSDFESGVPVGVVDVLAASGQNGWQWLDKQNAEGGGGQMPAGLDLQSLLAGTDPMDDILARIQALQEGRTPQAEQDALIQMLTGGGI